jgi:hypothetical protein
MFKLSEDRYLTPEQREAEVKKLADELMKLSESERVKCLARRIVLLEETILTSGILKKTKTNNASD